MSREIESVEIDTTAVNITDVLVRADTYYVIEFLETNPKHVLYGVWFRTSGVPHKFTSFGEAEDWLKNEDNVKRLKQPWLPCRIVQVQETTTIIAQFTL